MVIDTRKSLYRNTYVMITHNGSLSEPILDNTVPTNQGGCVILQIMRLQAKYQKDQIKTEGAHMIWKKMTGGRVDDERTNEGWFNIGKALLTMSATKISTTLPYLSSLT